MPADDDIAALEAQLDPAGRALIAMMRRYMDSLHALVEQLRGDLARRDETIAVLQRQLFGQSSEKKKGRTKVPRIADDIAAARAREPFSPLDDVEPNAPPPANPDGEQTARQRGRAKSGAARAAAKTKRKALPVVERDIDVTPEQLPEGYTREDFKPLGNGTVVERIEHVREHLLVLRYRLVTLQSKDRQHIITAKAPPSVTEGALYGPRLHAHVVVSKCLDAIPLHRQEKMLERAGCRIGRSVLCKMFHRAADLLEPIWRRLTELGARDTYVNFDETPQPVLDEEGCRQGWIWTMLTSNIAAYLFSDTRAGDTATNILAGTTGYLQVDGYAGYHAVCGPKGRTRVGCWAHVRRKFYDARANFPEANEAIELTASLYRLEADIAERGQWGAPAHAAMRDEHSRPIVEAIEKWIDDHAGLHPPKSSLGVAITYARNQRKHLREFLGDPNLRLDNNASERALRIIALGRRNFLFVGHDAAGRNLAILQTIVATCRLNDVLAYEYIADVLVRLQTHPSNRLDELLPMNWRPAGQERSGISG